MNIADTLAEREKTHGDFRNHSYIAQELKSVIRTSPNWIPLSDDKCEALEMIAHKIARVLSGDPNHHDHWHDIAGYATLIANTLKP